MKKFFLISTFLLATTKTNTFGMNPLNYDHWTLDEEVDISGFEIPEDDFGQETFCDFSSKQDAQDITFKETIKLIGQCFDKKISYDKNLENMVLKVPMHVMNMFNNFKTSIQAETNKIKQEMYKGTLLVIIKELFSQTGYNLICINNTYSIEKTNAKSSEKN